VIHAGGEIRTRTAISSTSKIMIHSSTTAKIKGTVVPSFLQKSTVIIQQMGGSIGAKYKKFQHFDLLV